MIQAFTRNRRTYGLDDKGEIQVAETISVRVPIQETLADQPVRAMKFL